MGGRWINAIFLSLAILFVEVQGDEYYPHGLNLTNFDGENGFTFHIDDDTSIIDLKAEIIGDINGDNFEDIAVTYRSFLNYARVFVIYGRKRYENIEMTASALKKGKYGFVIYLASKSMDSGPISISGAGDVNHDGFDDLLIGFQWYASDDENLYEGKVFLFMGKKEFPPGVDLDESIQFGLGFSQFAQLGFDVSSAGDFNCDGIDDFMISAPHPETTSVYIIFGGQTFPKFFNLSQIDGKNGILIYSDVFILGRSIAGGGDFNGDWCDDIAISAEEAGSVFVLYGHDKFDKAEYNISDINIGITITLKNYWHRYNHYSVPLDFGYDVNGDDLADLIIGCSHTHDGFDKEHGGDAFIIFGIYDPLFAGPKEIYIPEDIGGERAVSLSSHKPYTDSTGTSLSFIGDINDDGYADAIIGSPYDNRNQNGVAYVVFGRNYFGSDVPLLTLNATTGFKIAANLNKPYVGLVVHGGGDVNGDGISDFLVNGGTDRIYVVLTQHLSPFNPSKKKPKNSDDKIVASILASVLSVTFVIIFLRIFRKHLKKYCCCVKTRPTLGDIPVYSLEECKRVKQLGSGSFGEVWLAKVGERNVALKVPWPHADSSSIVRELSILASLPEHPNILPIVGVMTMEDTQKICIMTEYCAKGSIDKMHDKVDMKSLDGFRNVASQISRAVAVLHQCNVIHRDIACRNVFMKHDGTVLLGDYGLSKNSALEDRESFSSVAWRWAAPEVLRRERFTSMSDVYSLGVTFWEILTGGKLPFYEESKASEITLRNRISRGKLSLKVPQEQAEYLGEYYAEGIERCLSFSPKLRPRASKLCLYLDTSTVYGVHVTRQSDSKSVSIENSVKSSFASPLLKDYISENIDIKEFEDVVVKDGSRYSSRDLLVDETKSINI